MILLIDNYDSFSYNLYQLIGEIDPDIRVIRNDEMTAEEIKSLKPGSHHPLAGSGKAGGRGNYRWKRSQTLGQRYPDAWASALAIRPSARPSERQSPMRKN